MQEDVANMLAVPGCPGRYPVGTLAGSLPRGDLDNLKYGPRRASQAARGDRGDMTRRRQEI